MSFGPNPWQQTNWDWRAAGNFVCGGAGAGLVVFAALSGAQGPALAILLLVGLALVGVGLLCVWLEIGRPLRALHVFLNPRTSWMTREAFVATLLLPAGLVAALGWPGATALAALLAGAFIYCQARIVQAAKGIPAWREPLTVPLLVLTGLAEGGGLWLLFQGALDPQRMPAAIGQPLLLGSAAALLLARALVWTAWRGRLQRSAAPRALAAIDASGRWLQLGSWLPLAAIAVVAALATGLVPPAGGAAMPSALLAVAGALAVAAGAIFKFTLITRAGFNQGFALAHLPVRGARR